MNWKRKLHGSVLGFVGYMLSPLSWWNDLFVNVPLALAFAWILSLFIPRAFLECFVLGYWLTNILGFVLMHKGADKILQEIDRPYTRRAFLRDVGISLIYTLVIIVLVKFKFVEPLPEYFPKR
jgi:hypothetical protein